MVRTRFVCDRVVRHVEAPNAEVQTVVLKQTAGQGVIQIDTTKPEAADQFALGAEYIVDFTRA